MQNNQLPGVRTRNVEGLSVVMYALTVAAFALWLGYGILRSDWALMVPNAICLLLSLFIFAMLIMPARSRNHVADSIESTTHIE
jgi:MtN3 and saliva related transmembrane protein